MAIAVRCAWTANRGLAPASACGFPWPALRRRRPPPITLSDEPVEPVTRTEPTAGLIPEMRLLLACARRQMRPPHRQRACTAIARGVDWDRVILLADAHGVLPLLAGHATNGDVDVPAAPLDRLRERATANARHSLKLAAELVTVVRACAEHHIALLPLKGPVLAQSIYGSVALRQIRDLDFLVHEADLPPVIRVLEKLGYGMDRAPDAWSRRSTHHVAGRHPTERVRIELHHCLVMPRGRRRWSLETFAPRLITKDFMGVTILAFSAEDELVYLCEHGAGHAWSRLEWVVTVAELMRSHVHDWERVWTWAGQWNAVRRVRAGMMLANELIDERSDQGQAGTDAWASAANRAAVQRLIDEPTRIKATAFESLAYQFRTDSTAAGRLVRAWKTLIVPTADDAVEIELPRRLWALHYLVRPFRLLRRRINAGT